MNTGKVVAIGCLGAMVGVGGFLGLLWFVGGKEMETRAATPAAPREVGAVEVQRVWQDEYGDYAFALAEYRNTTSTTFSRVVEIKCTALDAAGVPINTNSRAFFASETGAVHPGFTGTQKVPVELNGNKLSSMRCEVGWAE